MTSQLLLALSRPIIFSTVLKCIEMRSPPGVITYAVNKQISGIAGTEKSKRLTWRRYIDS